MFNKAKPLTGLTQGLSGRVHVHVPTDGGGLNSKEVFMIEMVILNSEQVLSRVGPAFLFFCRACDRSMKGCLSI